MREREREPETKREKKIKRERKKERERDTMPEECLKDVREASE